MASKYYKKTFLHQYFRIIGICLGVPPTEFSWEYYDKSKEHHKVGPISPLDFYNDYVKKLFDVDEKVTRCLLWLWWNGSLNKLLGSYPGQS